MRFSFFGLKNIFKLHCKGYASIAILDKCSLRQKTWQMKHTCCKIYERSRPSFSDKMAYHLAGANEKEGGLRRGKERYKEKRASWFAQFVPGSARDNITCRPDNHWYDGQSRFLIWPAVQMYWKNMFEWMQKYWVAASEKKILLIKKFLFFSSSCFFSWLQTSASEPAGLGAMTGADDGRSISDDNMKQCTQKIHQNSMTEGVFLRVGIMHQWALVIPKPNPTR